MTLTESDFKFDSSSFKRWLATSTNQEEGKIVSSTSILKIYNCTDS